VHTVATTHGPLRLVALLRVLFAFEIACACAVVAAMSYREPLLGVAALAYAAGLLLSSRRSVPLSPASYDVFSNFYCVIWPISLAILLAVENPVFLPAVFVAMGLVDHTRIPRFFTVLVSPDARRLSAGEALERGKALAKAGKWTQARLQFLVAMEARPDDPDVLVNFGECALALGDLDTSYTVFHQAARQQPPSSRALYKLGFVSRLRGQLPEAITCLEKVVGLDPNRQQAYIQLALTLHESERDREALGWLERALSRWPQFARAAELHRYIDRNLAKTRLNAAASSSVVARRIGEKIFKSNRAQTR
jgi:tetratricopeptide (TPR) repeat protein